MPYCAVHSDACGCRTCRHEELENLAAIPDELELEASGQLSIGVEGEQRALPGLAPEGKPAPLTFTRDATEELARAQLAELTKEA